MEINHRCGIDNCSERLLRLLEDVDPGAFYRMFFNRGFFSTPHRIATDYIPTKRLNALWDTVMSCESAVDEQFPLGDIRQLFGWEQSIQSVVERYMRTGGQYSSIEESFINQVSFNTGTLLRDLFDTYGDLGTLVVDMGICDHMVRLMHLLWILRGIARQCDVVLQEYCVQHQIQTAHERVELARLW
jgi:hypothetical protein